MWTGHLSLRMVTEAPKAYEIVISLLYTVPELPAPGRTERPHTPAFPAEALQGIDLSWVHHCTSRP